MILKELIKKVIDKTSFIEDTDPRVGIRKFNNFKVEEHNREFLFFLNPSKPFKCEDGHEYVEYADGCFHGDDEVRIHFDGRYVDVEDLDGYIWQLSFHDTDGKYIDLTKI